MPADEEALRDRVARLDERVTQHAAQITQHGIEIAKLGTQMAARLDEIKDAQRDAKRDTSELGRYLGGDPRMGQIGVVAEVRADVAEVKVDVATVRNDVAMMRASLPLTIREALIANANERAAGRLGEYWKFLAAILILVIASLVTAAATGHLP